MMGMIYNISCFNKTVNSEYKSKYLLIYC